MPSSDGMRPVNLALSLTFSNANPEHWPNSDGIDPERDVLCNWRTPPESDRLPSADTEKLLGFPTKGSIPISEGIGPEIGLCAIDR